MNSTRSGRRYDRKFKQNAVALVRSGRSITKVARDLGVSQWSLGRWGAQDAPMEDGEGLLGRALSNEVPHQQAQVVRERAAELALG